jgi:hypothetical protein
VARQYFINGESMVTVKGSISSLIQSTEQLGLAQDAIQITEVFQHDDIGVDAYGNTPTPNPPDLQIFGAQAFIRMNLVHYDVVILEECIRLSMGGLNDGESVSEGLLARAGTLMGSNQPLYGPTNNYISLNIVSPVGGVPWLFYSCYLASPPVVYPLGTKRSVVELVWRAIAYSEDPWNNGTGSSAVPLYVHILQ